MKRNNMYDWSKLIPRQKDNFNVRLSDKQQKLIEKYLPFLMKRWGIPEQIVIDELKEININYVVSTLYLTGNPEKAIIINELSKLHEFINGLPTGIDTLSIKASKKNKETGKTKHFKPVSINSDYIIKEILGYCKSLQDPKKIKGVGRPPVSPEATQKERLYASTLNDRFTPIIKGVNERYFLIGVILLTAGIFTKDNSTIDVNVLINLELIEKVKIKEKNYLITRIQKLLLKTT